MNATRSQKGESRIAASGSDASTSTRPKRGAAAEPSPSIEPSTVEERIRLAAYRRAEQRGFEPGHELKDWLAAEAIVVAQSLQSVSGNNEISVNPQTARAGFVR